MIGGTDHGRLVPVVSVPLAGISIVQLKAGCSRLIPAKYTLQVGLDRGHGLARHGAELHGHLGVARRVAGVVLVVVVLAVKDIVGERGKAREFGTGSNVR